VLAVDATRVLTALCAASRGHAAGSPLALRRIASGVLGDTQRAAEILAALDLAGYVRTDTMGWYSGWVTDSGLFFSYMRTAEVTTAKLEQFIEERLKAGKARATVNRETGSR